MSIFKLSASKLGQITLSVAHKYGRLDLAHKNGVLTQQPIRTRIYYNLDDAKGESVDDVLKRFYRLNNGYWIHAKPNRRGKMYRKPLYMKFELQHHALCDKEQSLMLDRMVTDEFKQPTYYPDDPYEPYHKKHNVAGYEYLRNLPKYFP